MSKMTEIEALVNLLAVAIAEEINTTNSDLSTVASDLADLAASIAPYAKVYVAAGGDPPGAGQPAGTLIVRPA